MQKRTEQINCRTTPYHQELIKKIVEKEGTDKSKVIHSAIEFYAIYVLGQEEVMNLRLYKHFEF